MAHSASIPNRAGVPGAAPARTRLEASRDAPALARRFARHVLAGHRADGEFLERAELLVSEVVTNAVVHAGTPVWLSVLVADGVVHIEAEDGGGGWVARREPGNLRGPCAGYGLWLVDSLAESWGVEHGNADNERQGQPQDGRTKTKRVWLRLLLPL